MDPITIKVDFEVYNQNTDETYDCQSLDVEVDERQIREMARVMNNNGGFAPELSVCQQLDEHISEQCAEYYNNFFAPEDDDNFWNDYSIRYGEEVPEPIVLAAEKYVTHKEVDITYYYIVNGQEKSGMVTCDLQPATFHAMIEAAKKNHHGKTDFDSLKTVNAEAYDKVKQTVAAKVGNEVTDFTLKEFPYKVLEMAMMDAESTEDTGTDAASSEPEVEEVYLDEKDAPAIGTWKWAVEDLHIATSKDWKNRPMARDKYYVIRTDIPIPAVVMERIRQGHMPGQMEDKWFMYFENNIIHYHRSWSGCNTFNAYCEERKDGYAITKIEVDMEDYNTNPRRAPEALDYFLHTLAWHCGVSMDNPVSISVHGTATDELPQEDESSEFTNHQ